MNEIDKISAFIEFIFKLVCVWGGGGRYPKKDKCNYVPGAMGTIKARMGTGVVILNRWL